MNLPLTILVKKKGEGIIPLLMNQTIPRRKNYIYDSGTLLAIKMPRHFQKK